MSDLVGNPNCWFSHAQAYIVICSLQHYCTPSVSAFLHRKDLLIYKITNAIYRSPQKCARRQSRNLKAVKIIWITEKVNVV